MSSYSTKATRALNLITKKGGAVTVARKSKSTKNPVTGRYVPSDTTESTYAVIYDINKTLIDGENVRVGDMTALIPAITMGLQVGDIITSGSVNWRVQNPKPLMPDESTIILYEAQVRK